MRIAMLAALLGPVLAASAAAQPAPPTAPRPCVLMPRQGSALPPVAARPRDRCAALAFPRAEALRRR